MKKENMKKEEKGLLQRRAFLKYTSLAAVSSVLVATGCNNGDDDDDVNPDGDPVDLGSGDVGILNYAYALEQLEAAFYREVVDDDSFTTNFNEVEQVILRDVGNHEIVHKVFLQRALGGAAIPELEFDFSAVDFSSRQSVLEHARTFEDLGVAAYNGAGKLIQDVNNLLVAGKIVSVEGRHASAIRDLLNPGSDDFAGSDVISEDFALDRAFTPQQVLDAAGPFIVTELDASNLPTA